MVVEALDLREGDEIEISIAGKRDFKVARDRSKERAIEQLRQMKWSFPPNFKFNREVGWVHAVVDPKAVRLALSLEISNSERQYQINWRF